MSTGRLAALCGTIAASSVARIALLSALPASLRSHRPSHRVGAWHQLEVLAEAAGDVVLGAAIGRRGEDLLGRVVLDELAEPLALGAARDREERRHVGDARRLLHV